MTKFTAYILFFTLIIGVGLIYLYLQTSAKSPDLDQFAKCLQDKNVIMYGADWCPHCSSQKLKFGPSFKLVNYVECSENPDICNAKGITGYPTWFLSDTKLEGEQSLYKLAELTECPLPNNVHE